MTHESDSPRARQEVDMFLAKLLTEPHTIELQARRAMELSKNDALIDYLEECSDHQTRLFGEEVRNWCVRGFCAAYLYFEELSKREGKVMRILSKEHILECRSLDKEAKAEGRIGPWVYELGTPLIRALNKQIREVDLPFECYEAFIWSGVLVAEFMRRP